MKWREAMWNGLEPENGTGRLASWFHGFILWLIAINALAVLLGSMDSIAAAWGPWLDLFEIVSVAIFSLEYLARLYACTADPRYARPIRGRLRYMVTPMALVDLIAVLPLYLSPFVKLDFRMMRILRLARLLRLAKLARYGDSWALILRVLRSKRDELMVSVGLTMIMVLISSTLMYAVEHDVQPDVFPDIPSTMWWAVITLTTVGYGDVAPITPLGRILGAGIAIISVLMIALPTAVFASGFLDELGNKRKKAASFCPHCGKEI